MNYEEMSDKYKAYVEEHVKNIKLAFNWLYQYLPDLFDYCDSDLLGKQISSHDMSKWSKEEYDPYCEYFYGDNKTDEVKQNFDKAWLHHIHNNPHHWNYWVLIDNGETKALPMDYFNICEMILDWWTFSWKSGNLYEIFDWYDKHKDKMILHEQTRNIIEEILHKIKEVLDNG